MRNLNIFLALTISFTSSLNLPAAEISENEVNSYLEAIKEKEDEELLISSPQFKECEEKLGNFQTNTAGGGTDSPFLSQLKNCVKEKILSGTASTEGSEEDKLFALAESLGLSSFNKQAASSSKNIREYIEKRLYKAIYGVEQDAKSPEELAKIQLTNQDLFYQLYQEQIGKNTLLITSNYCLENFGLKGKRQGFLYINNDGQTFLIDNLIKEDATKSSDTSKFSERYSLNQEKLDLIAENYANIIAVPGLESAGSIQKLFKDYSNNLSEYAVCTASSDKNCKSRFDNHPYRSTYENKLLTQIELNLAKHDPEKNLIKLKYGICVTQILPSMCEIYRCNNVYNQNTPNAAKNCSEKFSIEIGSKKQKLYNIENAGAFDASTIDKREDLSLDSVKDKTGYIACNVMQRLEDYRLIIKGVKQIQEDNKSNMAVKGIRSNRKLTDLSNDKINKVLTISSKDLAVNVDSLKNAKNKAEELRKNCLEGNELDGFKLKEGAKDDKNCKSLLASLDKAGFEIIQLDTEAKVAVEMQELEGLSDKEALKKYLEEHNMSQYLSRLEALSVDELKNIISADYQSKKMALIDELKQRFKEERQIDVGEDASTEKNSILETSIALENIDDMEQHKERIETLIEYSNIVSSYLEVKDNEGNSNANSTSRIQELSNSDNELLKEYYTGQDSNATTAKGSLNYDSLYTKILGADHNSTFSEEEKEKINENEDGTTDTGSMQ